MKKSQLKKFAKLAVRMGANVRKGQEVVINAALDQPEFVTMVVEEAYKAGAKSVTVEWSHQPLTRLNVKYMSLETLSTVTDWRLAKMKHAATVLPAMIHIISNDPDGLKGVDQGKVAQANQKTYPIMKPFIDEMDNKYQWTIIAVPGVAWARKVFPNLSPKKAVNALWDAILTATRVVDNPIKGWKEHNQNIFNRRNHLNEMNLDYVHITSKRGTDVKIGLSEHAQWLGGSDKTLKGIIFNPNMPTEEVFITPDKNRTEGTIHASMPLSYRGEIIDDFSVTFEKGKVVSIKASHNQNLLEQMITMDEGAKMLGELALVPIESPIRQSGILFYNTLFDENAACHVALGRAYTNSIKDYQKFSKEQLDELGVNVSMIHVDFMFGDVDTNIDGYTKDGKKIAIFKDGTWAF